MLIFSIGLDEIRDTTDVSQLLIIVKTVDDQFSTKKELPDLVSLAIIAKGSEIYNP